PVDFGLRLTSAHSGLRMFSADGSRSTTGGPLSRVLGSLEGVLKFFRGPRVLRVRDSLDFGRSTSYRAIATVKSSALAVPFQESVLSNRSSNECEPSPRPPPSMVMAAMPRLIAMLESGAL